MESHQQKARNIIFYEQEKDYYGCFHKFSLSNFSIWFEFDKLLSLIQHQWKWLYCFCPERKVMVRKDNIFLSETIVDHIWFEYFCWRFVFCWNAERKLIDLRMTWESHEQCLCRNVEKFPEICWMIESLKIVACNVKFKNQVLIMKYDNDYHSIVQIFICHHQT